MGLFDKFKKKKTTESGSSSGSGGSGSGSGSGGAQGGRGQGQGGSGSGGGNRNRNRNRSGQGGQGGQGGNRSQGGNRAQRGSERDSSGEQGDGAASGSSSGRRRGSRGGRGRGGQGGQGGQGGAVQQQAQGTEQRDSGGQQRDGQSTTSGSSSSSRRRRRGGRGRGSGNGSGQGASNGQGGSGESVQGASRTVTRSNAAELKEQQEQGGGRQGGAKKRSGSGAGNGNRNRSSNRKRSGSGSGGSGSGRRRERTRRGSSSSGSRRRVLDANERPKEPVKKQILINAADPNEIRVAIREQQTVVEVYVERKGKRSLAGNIYKGRVQNVLRGMEAAFVDIGLERNGFLYVDEITPAAADSDQIMKVTMVTEMETSNAAETPTAAAVTEDGEVVTVELPSGTPQEAMAQAAADNDETLDIDDAMEEEDREEAEAAKEAEGDKPKEDKAKGRGRTRIQNKKKIQDLLKPGQEILCQVVKDPMGTKGSRLTTQYSLAGRYLVYVPDGEGLGVSRRLEEAERNRLRDIVKQFELPWGGGMIVRTAAEGALEEDIAKDLQLLLRLQEQLMDKAGQARAPKLLYNEADLSLRIIRDLMNDEVEEVLVDDDRQYQRIMNYLKRTSPILAERVRMHDGQRPLFESYGVEEAIRSTLSKRAELPSGGYLILDKTEAFHVIDVNTGRNVGTASLEETITKTNMEAAVEVVRQLRLRDLGGIIVIDFIDMNQMKNRDAVLEHFRTELSKDRTKTYLVEISPLGLVEMTRQNVSEGVREILTSTCRDCEGRGVVVSAETHAIEVERAVVELAAGLGDEVAAMAIETQPDVARVLAGNQGKQAELDKRAGKVVRVFPDPDLSPNTFALRAKGDGATIEALAEPLLRGTKHKVTIDRVDPTSEEDGLAIVDGVLVTIIGAGALVGEERTILIAACAGGRAFATLVKPARRRRRRGGRGRKKTTVAVGAAGSTEEHDDSAESSDDHDGDDHEGDEDGDEYEDVDDDGDDERDPDAPNADEDDGRTEIPQRLVMLDEDDPDQADDDNGDDDDHDDNGDDDDHDDDDHDDDDHDDDGDDDGSDDEGGSDDDSEQLDSDDDDDDDVDDEDAVADDDVTIDAASFAANDEGADRPLARRVPSDDHDEPSIDADGRDILLEQRGVTRPAETRAAGSQGSDGGSERPSGQGGQGGSGGGSGTGNGQRRRRRGSRGGRNRNRSGSGSGSAGSSGSSNSSRSSNASNDG